VRTVLAWLTLATLLTAVDAVAQEPVPPLEPVPPTVEVVEVVEDAEKEYHFRIGFSGFGAFDRCGCDHAVLKPGAAVVLPHFDAIFKYGLGIRLGFVVHYHQGAHGSYGNQIAGVDVTYFAERDDPGSVTTQRVPAYVFSYGMTINFKYEVTVAEEDPAYRLFKWVQPYFGTGVGLIWTRTHTDLPDTMAILIENEAYRGVNPVADMDPWSTQFGPAFNLFGGFHFNVAPKFRINYEMGFFLVDVPSDGTGAKPDPDGGLDGDPAYLTYSTDGHYAHHEPYKIEEFVLGGGFEWLF